MRFASVVLAVGLLFGIAGPAFAADTATQTVQMNVNDIFVIDVTGNPAALTIAAPATGGQTPADALYVVFVGNNDVRDALDALTVDPSGVTSITILGEALGAIQQDIVTLATAGARHFLVANVPDLSLVPAVILAGAAAQGAALVLATNFNSGLATVLLGLEGAIPGIRIAALDTFGLLRELVGPPSVFGNVSDPCITPGTRVSPYCTRPDVYLFWDGIHPTRVGHGAVAQRALETLLQQ